MTLPQHINDAAELLRQGRLVAFPTETVYGLGADATNEHAVRNIFAAKQRPMNHPLIVHIANIKQLPLWALDVSPLALRLAAAYWPGPLTMIFKKQASVLNVVTGNQETVGIRIPRHPTAQALLQIFGGGIAAPSANQFTHLSPTSAADVKEELDGKVDLILDGGHCEVGVESTIIDMTRDLPVILRPGMITSEMISATLGVKIDVRSREKDMLLRARAHTQADTHAREDTRTPGMHHLHYAPLTKTELIATCDISKLMTQEKEKIALLIHSDVSLPTLSHIHLARLSPIPADYAHDLYHTLRELDHQHFTRIMIEEVPRGSDWEAISDRLMKASGSTHQK